MNRIAAIVALSAGVTAALADMYHVEINGQVWGNQIRSGALADVTAGETATIAFDLDETSTITGSFPTLGYEIISPTFELSFSGGASVGLNPAFDPSYFVVRNNDPAADGFFLSHGPDFPSALETPDLGFFDYFGIRFNVSYLGDTLDSFDLADAVGYYDYTGLTVFGMGVNDGPIEDVLGMDFVDMTISKIPAPATLLALAPLAALRRRR